MDGDVLVKAAAPVTARFTPGPWEVVRQDYIPEAGDEWRMRVRSLDSEEMYLDLIEDAYFVEMRPGEREANAHLIAAAPALYEALRELLNYAASSSSILSFETRPSHIRWLESLALACVFARAALAKADGR